MSFTMRFLTDDFELKTQCLETVYFPESHTGENIALGLREVLASWDLHADQKLGQRRQSCEGHQAQQLQGVGHKLHLATRKCLNSWGNKLLVIVTVVYFVVLLFCNRSNFSFI